MIIPLTLERVRWIAQGGSHTEVFTAEDGEKAIRLVDPLVPLCATIEWLAEQLETMKNSANCEECCEVITIVLDRLRGESNG
jgi:hypothetical protein